MSTERAHRTVWPPTVYRALESLVKRGLVHRVESLSAFIVCEHSHNPHRAVVLAICQRCGQTNELEDADLLSAVELSASRSHFSINSASVELHGVCNTCELPESSPK